MSISKPKKTKTKKTEMPILKLDEEEPLILDQIHNEKIVHQEEKKHFKKQVNNYLLQQEKW